MRARASLLDFLERLLVTFWAGGLWVIGFVAAPVLFRVSDDRLLVGRFAGSLFEAMAITGLVCGALLLILIVFRAMPHWRPKVVVVLSMSVLSAAGLYLLYPEMRVLRDSGLATAAGHERFSFLHVAASVLFLIQSLLAAFLVWLGARSAAR